MDAIGIARPTVVAVIQARMRSTRLPGKVLQMLAGRSVLAWVVRAAQQAQGIDEVVVATSDSAADDPVAKETRNLGIRIIRGSEDDVLSRFIQACRFTQANAIVRLTADCPLLDPTLITQVVAAWRADPRWDYVSTTLVRTLPRGLDVELTSARALKRANHNAMGHDRVHVTSSIYTNPQDYRLLGLVVHPAANDLRLTLDTREDADAISAVVAAIGDRAPAWEELVTLLRARPEIVAINREVVQKRLEEC